MENKEEKIFYELRDFVKKSWYYDNEGNNMVVNADSLLGFIEWLESEV